MSYQTIEISSKSQSESNLQKCKQRLRIAQQSLDRIPESHVSRKIGNYTKTHTGALPEKDCKVSSSTKTMDIKEIECFKCHKKEHYANNCPMQRRRIR